MGVTNPRFAWKRWLEKYRNILISQMVVDNGDLLVESKRFTLSKRVRRVLDVEEINLFPAKCTRWAPY